MKKFFKAALFSSAALLSACSSAWKPDSLNSKGHSQTVEDGYTGEAEEQDIKRDINEALAQTDVMVAKDAANRAPIAILTDHSRNNGRSIMPATREIFGYSADRSVRITYVFSDRRGDKKEYVCNKDVVTQPVFTCRKAAVRW